MSLSSLNRAEIIGHLGQDVELRYTKSEKPVATFSVATNEAWTDANGEKQEEVSWHRITAWGKLAEICDQYLKKGSQVYIDGPLKTRKWTDKEGIERWTTEITARQLVMLGSGSGGGSGVPHPAETENGSSGSRKQPQKTVELDDRFDDLDDDLPF